MKHPSIDTDDLEWLSRLARALLRDSQAADDLVQDTVVAALEGGPSIEHPRAWLGSVARRLVARRYRGEARRRRREQLAAVEERLPDSVSILEKAEAETIVVSAVKKLPEPIRRTVLSRYLQGNSVEEIAAHEERSLDTVRWRLRRGMTLLRSELRVDQSEGAASWGAILWPLLPASQETGKAAAGLSGASAAPAAAWIAMKFFPWIMAVVGGASLWWAWSPTDQVSENRSTVPSQTSNESQAGFSSEDQGPPEPFEAARESVDLGLPEDIDASVDTAIPVEGMLGRVLNSLGEPIPDAKVYLIESNGGEGGQRSTVAEKLAKTEANGEFLVDPEESRIDSGSWDIGVSANGYLRFVTPFTSSLWASGEWVLVLDRGNSLKGYVVDERGAPVQGIELLAFSANAASIHHVSPSQVRLRGDRAELGNIDSPYHQCVRRTDRLGSVVFEGLGESELLVRSLDPGWALIDSSPTEPGGPYVIWTATPTLGARLEVIDSLTGSPVEKASGVFCVDIQFEGDLEFEDFSQWVGRGEGGVSIVIDSESLPPLKERTIAKARFYGTVSSGLATQEWSGAELVAVNGAVPVTELRIMMNPREANEEAPSDETAIAEPEVEEEPALDALIRLDVFYPDRTQFRGFIDVGWEQVQESGRILRGSGVPRSLGNGQFEVKVPQGASTITVAESSASGSLRPWSKDVSLTTNVLEYMEVTLPQAASALIERPSGWSGYWYVHASWRMSEDDDWQGSWYYGTDDDTLVLNALRAALWRFRILKDQESDEGEIVRTVNLLQEKKVTVGDG